ncbi:hypothetical protein C2E23DRAFT_24538 [Lenzites betulinus]|nr:hypothetical protein C2E23DRAFT_24538 [Lenzites betulinus]
MQCRGPTIRLFASPFAFAARLPVYSPFPPLAFPDHVLRRRQFWAPSLSRGPLLVLWKALV